MGNGGSIWPWLHGACVKIITIHDIISSSISGRAIDPTLTKQQGHGFVSFPSHRTNTRRPPCPPSSVSSRRFSFRFLQSGPSTRVREEGLGWVGLVRLKLLPRRALHTHDTCTPNQQTELHKRPPPHLANNLLDNQSNIEPDKEEESRA